MEGVKERRRKYMHIGISQRVEQIGETHNNKEREREKRERHLPTSWNRGTTRILVALEGKGVEKEGARKQQKKNLARIYSHQSYKVLVYFNYLPILLLSFAISQNLSSACSASD